MLTIADEGGEGGSGNCWRGGEVGSENLRNWLTEYVDSPLWQWLWIYHESTLAVIDVNDFHHDEYDDLDYNYDDI